MNNLLEISYNGKKANIRVIDDKECLLFKDVIYLSGRCFSYFYKVLKKNKHKLKKYIIEKNTRGTLLTLEGCIEFLSMVYNPEDGLIAEIRKHIPLKAKDVLPDWCKEEKSPTMVCSSSFKKPQVESFVDIELERIKKEKIKDDLKERDKEFKVEAIYKVVKDLDIRLMNVECQLSKIFDELTKCRSVDDKCDQSEPQYIKGIVKGLIKEILCEVLNG